MIVGRKKVSASSLAKLAKKCGIELSQEAVSRASDGFKKDHPGCVSSEFVARCLYEDAYEFVVASHEYKAEMDKLAGIRDAAKGGPVAVFITCPLCHGDFLRPVFKDEAHPQRKRGRKG